MANWPTLPDDATSLPDLSDGPPNLATAEAVANIPRRFLRKASLWLGSLSRGGGLGDGMCVAQDTPNLTVKVAAIDSFYSLASPAIALTKTSGAPFTSPAAVAPATNPYIALLTVDSAGTLAWTYGAEAASPVRPAIPADKWPLWYAYLRPGSTAIRDTDGGSGGYLNGPGGAGDARYGKVAPFGAAAGTGYVTVQDEGTPRTARTVLNFTGAGVTATDDAGGARTTVNVPGGAGSYVGGSATLSAGDVTTTSTTFVALTGASIAITTGGGPVLLIFNCVHFNSTTAVNCFDFAVDGTRQNAAAAFGLAALTSPSGSPNMTLSMVWVVESLAGGAHTFTVQWKVNVASTATVRADGTNFRARFQARELPG